MPIAPKVRIVGYLPARPLWIRREFRTVDFQFILKGCGRLRYGKRTIPIKAPCVFVAWPGAYLEFGPEPEGATWEQLFMVYDSGLASMFDAWDIHPSRKPVWPIASPQTIRNLINELIGCMRNVNALGMVDRIDRVCERLLLESRLEQAVPPKTPHDADLDHIRRHLSRNLDQRYDAEVLARQYGMAEVTFRRYWTARFGTPFKRDIMNLRMQEACRLLTETDREIKEIAGALGFGDPLYFSRRFAKLMGDPPTEYRKRFSDTSGDA